MTHQIPNVRTWSKSVPPYLFAVSDLDVYVLKQHPELLSAMGRAPTADRGDLPDVPILVTGMIAPVAGISILSGMGAPGMPGRWVGDVGSSADGLAAWCFMIALAAPVLVAWRWGRSQRHWRGFDVAGTVITGAAGILTLMAMRTDGGVDISLLSLPVWLSVILAALVGVAMASASQGRRTPFRTYFRVTGPADPQGVTRLVDALEPRRREKLLEERRHALDRLRDRGLIDEPQRRAIGALPLGFSPTIEG